MTPREERERASRRKYRQTWNPRFFIELSRAMRARYRWVGRIHSGGWSPAGAFAWFLHANWRFSSDGVRSPRFDDHQCPNNAPHRYEWRDPS